MARTRVSATITPAQAKVLQREADRARVTASAVVQAAIETLAADGRAAQAIRKAIRPTNRGGARPGAGRPKTRLDDEGPG